ncbi:hypothetical protein [Pseudoxanthomonas winnipegensis]|uniref:Uncharacterized protein n=1 Tax=Pseudoxanthomonas winnipegensis TaxID=2480810 RepID=A0A4Q8LDA6_9GAMM|nr:hypothetical protein [Pseudoxanthomonas winnipegensis]TAA26550.1 hypothetical protein EA660_04775 [Pseudoxanthomonas winnipegensis]
MKTSITLTIDTSSLTMLDDKYLAAMWHAAQLNPAPIEDADAGYLAESLGREIIRRFLSNTPPLLWDHQGHHAYSCQLQDLKARLTDQSPPIALADANKELLDCLRAVVDIAEGSAPMALGVVRHARTLLSNAQEAR